MMEFKMFFRDFITQAKIRKYLIALVAFAVTLFVCFKDKQIIKISDTAGSMIGMGIAFTSAAYMIHTYSTMENIRLYLTLPVRKWKLTVAYFLALWICTLFQRVSFVMVVIAVFGSHVMENALLLMLYPAAAVWINIGILSACKKSTLIWNVILAVILFLTAISGMEYRYQAVCAVLTGAGAIYGCRKMDITDLIIRQNPGIKTRKKMQNKTYKKGISNYFFQIVAAEKIYLGNTVCIAVFLVVLCIANKNHPVMGSLVWCIGAVNTPFLTMISADRWITRHMDMLPVRQNNLYKQYAVFLAGYFLPVNLAVVWIRCMMFHKVLLEDMVLALLLVPLETVVAQMLEKKCRISGWQTKQELWKHPRKYILPLTVFAFVALYSFLMQAG